MLLLETTGGRNKNAKETSNANDFRWIWIIRSSRWKCSSMQQINQTMIE